MITEKTSLVKLVQKCEGRGAKCAPALSLLAGWLEATETDFLVFDMIVRSEKCAASGYRHRAVIVRMLEQCTAEVVDRFHLGGVTLGKLLIQGVL